VPQRYGAPSEVDADAERQRQRQRQRALDREAERAREAQRAREELEAARAEEAAARERERESERERRRSEAAEQRRAFVAAQRQAQEERERAEALHDAREREARRGVGPGGEAPPPANRAPPAVEVGGVENGSMGAGKGGEEGPEGLGAGTRAAGGGVRTSEADLNLVADSTFVSVGGGADALNGEEVGAERLGDSGDVGGKGVTAALRERLQSLQAQWGGMSAAKALGDRAGGGSGAALQPPESGTRAAVEAPGCDAPLVAGEPELPALRASGAGPEAVQRARNAGGAASVRSSWDARRGEVAGLAIMAEAAHAAPGDGDGEADMAEEEGWDAATGDQDDSAGRGAGSAEEALALQLREERTMADALAESLRVRAALAHQAELLRPVAQLWRSGDVAGAIREARAARARDAAAGAAVASALLVRVARRPAALSMDALGLLLPSVPALLQLQPPPLLPLAGCGLPVCCPHPRTCSLIPALDAAGLRAGCSPRFYAARRRSVLLWRFKPSRCMRPPRSISRVLHSPSPNGLAIAAAARSRARSGERQSSQRPTRARIQAAVRALGEQLRQTRTHALPPGVDLAAEVRFCSGEPNGLRHPAGLPAPLVLPRTTAAVAAPPRAVNAVGRHTQLLAGAAQQGGGGFQPTAGHGRGAGRAAAAGGAGGHPGTGRSRDHPGCRVSASGCVRARVSASGCVRARVSASGCVRARVSASGCVRARAECRLRLSGCFTIRREKAPACSAPTQSTPPRAQPPTIIPPPPLSHTAAARRLEAPPRVGAGPHRAMGSTAQISRAYLRMVSSEEKRAMPAQHSIDMRVHSSCVR
jgi:hypothetical protein